MGNALSGGVKAAEVGGGWYGEAAWYGIVWYGEPAGKKRDGVSDGFPMGCSLALPSEQIVY